MSRLHFGNIHSETRYQKENLTQSRFILIFTTAYVVSHVYERNRTDTSDIETMVEEKN